MYFVRELEIYYDPKHAAGFGSVAKLIKVGKCNKSNVEKWLSAQDASTLHNTIRKRFPNHPYRVRNIEEFWEMNLAD